MVRIFHGKLLDLLADFAAERPVGRQSRDGRAHLDSHEVWLLRREAQRILDGGPSWWQGNRPQPANQAQDLCEQGPRDGDPGKLENDVAAMAYDLGLGCSSRAASPTGPLRPVGTARENRRARGREVDRQRMKCRCHGIPNFRPVAENGAITLSGSLFPV